MSEADTDRLSWSRLFALCSLHEVTLQALLGARNYAVLQLLKERNDLLREQYLALAFSIFDALFLTLFFSGESRSAVLA